MITLKESLEKQNLKINNSLKVDFHKELNDPYFVNILKHNSKSSLTEVFLNTCVNYISSRLKKEYQQGIYPIADIDVISHFYSGAVLSTIVWWLESNSSMSEAELCDMIINLIFKVPKK